jgi:hypothetical protein
VQLTESRREMALNVGVALGGEGRAPRLGSAAQAWWKLRAATTMTEQKATMAHRPIWSPDDILCEILQILGFQYAGLCSILGERFWCRSS